MNNKQQSFNTGLCIKLKLCLSPGNYNHQNSTATSSYYLLKLVFEKMKY